MSKFFKWAFYTFSLLTFLSLYANFLHPYLFFCKAALEDSDTAFIKKGRDIAFLSGGAWLKGKIVTRAPKGIKVPLIVFCVGAAESSYATNYAKFIDSFFLQNLPMDSVAVLYFDKRGVGASEGTWYDTDFDQRAADAKAAAEYAQTLPFIDRSRIAIAGHSQGGWIAQICLSRYPETFSVGISLAGPTFGVQRQLVNDYASILICRERLDWRSAVRKAERRVSRDMALATFFPFVKSWRQLKTIKDFDPAADLKKIRSPILLLFGEHDRLVNPQWCRNFLAATFRNHLPSCFDTLTIKKATHSFKVGDFCGQGVTRPTPYAEECKMILGRWIRKHLIEGRS